MKKQMTTLVISLCLGLGAVSSVAADMKRDIKHLKQLDLSQQQEQQIRAIVKQTREDNSVFKGEKQEIRLQMRDLMEMPAWDAAQAESIFNTQFELGQTAALNRAKAKNQIYNLLTQEQQDELSQKAAANADRRDNASNENKPRKKRRGGDLSLQKLKKALSLSDEQFDAIKAIRQEAKTEMQAYRDAMKSQKAALRSITQSDSFDEDAFLAQLASANDLKLAVRMIQSKARYDSLSLLNDEQKIKMKKIMKKMKEKRR